MRIHGLRLGALALSIGAVSAGMISVGMISVAEARSLRHHRRYAVAHSSTTYVAPRGVYANSALPPLAGTAGTAIPPEAARFMGYPYNVPGYRYVGYDACLLRVGGVFGPGPSSGPCPFGLDKAF